MCNGGWPSSVQFFGYLATFITIVQLFVDVSLSLYFTFVDASTVWLQTMVQLPRGAWWAALVGIIAGILGAASDGTSR